MDGQSISVKKRLENNESQLLQSLSHDESNYLKKVVSQSSGIGIFNKSSSKQSLIMKHNTLEKSDINIVKPNMSVSKKNSKPEIDS